MMRGRCGYCYKVKAIGSANSFGLVLCPECLETYLLHRRREATGVILNGHYPKVLTNLREGPPIVLLGHVPSRIYFLGQWHMVTAPAPAASGNGKGHVVETSPDDDDLYP